MLVTVEIAPTINSNSATVSVAVPAHDAAVYLPETLDSFLAQDFPSLEVIVVDDGSTDDTPRVMEAYRNRVTYIRQDASGGPSRPRNVGVAATTVTCGCGWSVQDTTYLRQLVPSPVSG